MTAGLPGTGISGLFYLISIVIMFAYETYLTISGKSSKKRWSAILPQIIIATIMIIVGYITNLALTASIQAYRSYHGLPQKELTRINPLLVPVILLICVLAAVYSAQLFNIILSRAKPKKFIITRLKI